MRTRPSTSRRARTHANRSSVARFPETPILFTVRGRPRNVAGTRAEIRAKREQTRGAICVEFGRGGGGNMTPAGGCESRPAHVEVCRSMAGRVVVYGGAYNAPAESVESVQRRYAREHRSDDRAALIECHQGLAQSIAYRFCQHKHDLEDRMQIALLGLLHAVFQVVLVLAEPIGDR